MAAIKALVTSVTLVVVVALVSADGQPVCAAPNGEPGANSSSKAKCDERAGTSAASSNNDKSDAILVLLEEISRLRLELIPSDKSVASVRRSNSTKREIGAQSSSTDSAASTAKSSVPSSQQTICDKSIGAAALGYRVLCRPQRLSTGAGQRRHPRQQRSNLEGITASNKTSQQQATDSPATGATTMTSTTATTTESASLSPPSLSPPPPSPPPPTTAITAPNNNQTAAAMPETGPAPSSSGPSASATPEQR